MSETSVRSGGVSFLSLLALLFIALKLIGEHFHTPVADWPWWLVLVPLWGGLAALAALFLVFSAAYGALRGIEYVAGRASGRRR